MSKTKQITFAEKAKQINKRYKNKDSNAQEMRGWEVEMENLMRQQEAARMKELAIQSLREYRKPTNASKYETGGPLTDMMAQTVNYLNPNVPSSNLFPNPFQSNIPPVNTAQALDAGNLLSTGQLGTVGNYKESKGFESPFQRIATPPTLATTPIMKTPQVKVSSNSSEVVDDRNIVGDADKGTGNLYAPLAIGKGIEFAGKLAMLADGYDKVKPQYNPNESRVESLMANRSIDTAALENNALSQQNVALANLTDVRSPNVKRALVQNAIQGTLRNLQDTKLQENQMNNQYKADYANTLNNLGTQKVQADNYAEQLNTQSKSNYQQGLQNMLATVGNVGQKVTDYKTTVAQQELVTSMLSTKNFKAGSASAIQEKLRQGIPLEEGDFIQLYTSNGKSKDEALTDYNALMAKLYNK